MSERHRLDSTRGDYSRTWKQNQPTSSRSPIRDVKSRQSEVHQRTVGGERRQQGVAFKRRRRPLRQGSLHKTIRTPSRMVTEPAGAPVCMWKLALWGVKEPGKAGVMVRARQAPPAQVHGRRSAGRPQQVCRREDTGNQRLRAGRGRRRGKRGPARLRMASRRVGPRRCWCSHESTQVGSLPLISLALTLKPKTSDRKVSEKAQTAFTPFFKRNVATNLLQL